MKTIIKSTVVIGLVLSLGSPVLAAEPAEAGRIQSASDSYWARVQAGFDDMLGHEPYRGSTQTTVQLPSPDPAADIINNGLSPEHQDVKLVNADESKL